VDFVNMDTPVSFRIRAVVRALHLEICCYSNSNSSNSICTLAPQQVCLSQSSTIIFSKHRNKL
jgi:hypothetical protein